MEMYLIAVLKNFSYLGTYLKKSFDKVTAQSVIAYSFIILPTSPLNIMYVLYNVGT